MMIESAIGSIWGISLAALAGVVLGAMFFGGLWWTVRHALHARHPALWFVGSALLRMGLALGGFYWVGVGVAGGAGGAGGAAGAGQGASWQRLLACLIGFTLARVLVSVGTKSAAEKLSGASHAP